MRNNNPAPDVNYSDLIDQLIIETEEYFNQKNIKLYDTFLDLNKKTSFSIDKIISSSHENNLYLLLIQNKQFNDALTLTTNILNDAITSNNTEIIEDWFDKYLLMAEINFNLIFQKINLDYKTNFNYDNDLNTLNDICRAVMICIDYIDRYKHSSKLKITNLTKKWTQNHENINKLIIERFNEN